MCFDISLVSVLCIRSSPSRASFYCYNSRLVRMTEANEFVLITGCDTGFGKILVDRLIERHSEVGLIACYYTELGMKAGPAGMFKHIVDVTCDESVQKLRKSVIAFLAKHKDAKLIGIVNNAGGLLSSGPIEWTPVELDRAQIELNFIGTVRITKAFLSLVRQSGKGRVVNVSSILGLISSPLGGVYAASKYAVEGWTDALRREMLPFGVHVSLIEPGMFRGTEFYKHYTTPVENGWTSLDPEIKAAYGDHYKQYAIDRLLKLFAGLGSSDPSPVVGAMEHALLAPKPYRRYRLGFDCVVLARVLNWLPICLTDLALTVADVMLIRDLHMLPKMPAKGVSNSSVSIVWFSLFGYSTSMWWIIACFLALIYLVF